jgi:hypothetical protein
MLPCRSPHLIGFITLHYTTLSLIVRKHSFSTIIILPFIFSLLQRPRYMMTILPEFQQVEGKNAFVKNHPVPPFEKDVWKKTLTLAEQWGHYEGAYTKSVGLLDELNASLVELDKLVYSTEYCTEGTISVLINLSTPPHCFSLS